MDHTARPSLVGSTLSHYRINSSIGSGGMGEVYRATDTKLGREVALKVLPPAMAGDADRLARFQREARVVAALNHPNVVTIYSVERSEDVQFITMELIEGHALERLIPENGLPFTRIVEIAGALSEALAAAHERGIVHRDLKPANVMITHDGRVKVLDFGLAKDVSAEGSNNATVTSAGHTQAGVVMGTPSYMSPEQITGRPLDHRTDIFSLGIILHEMATGKRPFHGSSSAELVSSILRDNPPLVTELRSDLPADLARIIRRCLEKDPRRRLQTVRDVGNEFRDLSQLSPQPAAASSLASRIIAAADSGAARADDGFWVAVLPFKCSCADSSLTNLADGLAEEIITGLSRFSYLRVIGQRSTARYAGQQVDLRTAARELNARYVMEGSLRQAGTKLRLAVQLVDAASGAHLWAETFDRAYSLDQIFELQDELVPRIVSTVADMHGVLPRTMSESLRGKSEDSLTPHESLLRSFNYFFHSTPEEHAVTRRVLERAVEQSPDQADAWALLAVMYFVEFADEFNPLPNSLDRGLTAAHRAISLAPSHPLGHYALAFVHFFRKEWVPMRAEVDRAVTLNPMDGAVLGLLGIIVDHAGDEQRGQHMVETAIRLNPNHPGIFHFVAFNREYRHGRYAEALEAAVRIRLPGFFHYYAVLAAAHGQLGQHDAAQNDLRELLAIRPNFAAEVRREFLKWFNPEITEKMIEGLRKAGLEIPDATDLTASLSSGIAPRTASGESRAAEGYWVAVLPFKYTGASVDLKALAEGISDEVITGLARFSYLRVVARGSTAKYMSESNDVRAIGKELGARYIMEGSIRQAGNKLRLAVQLTDAATGTHLWAENYEHHFNPEALFELQDDLVPRIVSTVADYYGILPHTICDALRRRKADDQLSPHEAVLRAFNYFERVTAEEHAQVREILERAARSAPNQGEIWAMLSTVYWHEHALGFNPQPDPLGRALAAARRGIDVAPTNNLGYSAMATVLYLQKDILAFRSMAERAIELNPMDGSNMAHVGLLMAYSGDWGRGCALAEAALKLNPNHPGWYWFAHFMNAYRKADYRAALTIALKFNMPGYYTAHALTAAVYGQLCMREQAQRSVQDLLSLRPQFAESARTEFGQDHDPELLEHLIDGLRKAGLDIPQADAGSVPALTSGKLTASTISAASRGSEGFWVAVLPFKYTGSGSDIAALAEGFTDDIITGMSRFSYLRVVARSSTARYANQAIDARIVGKEIGAHYVMEGSIRLAGTKVRAAVQLVDAINGTSLWAETYDRPFNPDSTFDLLDDVVPRIVATVGDTQGILAHSMTETLRGRDPESFTPYEALLRSFGFHQHVNAAEHLVGVKVLERAVEQAPDRADCWAMLSWLYRAEHSNGFNTQPNAMDRSLAAAQRAVALAPASHLANAALASAFFFRHELGSFRAAADRALALNNMEGYITAFLGMHFAYAGDWERGCALSERATQLNPNHPGWYWFAMVMNAYRLHESEHALELALRMNMPGLWTAQAALTAIYAQLGKMDEARSALRRLLALRPGFAATARAELEKFWLPELAGKMLGDLCKAGLEVPDNQGSL